MVQKKLRSLPFKAFHYRGMNRYLIKCLPYWASIIPAIILLTLNIGSVEASWLIDGKRFHVSVHGQTECMDCHEDISDKEFHPNPVNVYKKSTDFFTLDKCTACHDHIPEELAEGRHGGQKVDDPKKYGLYL